LEEKQEKLLVKEVFKPYRMLLVKEERIDTIHAILDEVSEKYANYTPFAEMA